uniref:Cytochrome c biogenesis protein transmembrane region n=1 Tax=Eucheuma denticulatum TaxID=305493 RepID=A0A8E7PGC5_9FLOR|nr:cytochrome c biogenesis protein transmembrane region [Eucheuma denticulatum]
MIYQHQIMNLLEIKSYYLQQEVYRLFFSQLQYTTLSTFTLVFVGGLVTSINPCLISVLPLSLSPIQHQKSKKIRKDIIIYGLISSLVIMILIIALLNASYYKLKLQIKIFSSLLTIILGLNLLQILEFNIFNVKIAKTKILGEDTNQLITTWIIGFTIGINSSSCSTPILTTLVIWLSNSKNFLLGILYIICYLTGYAIPVWILINISISNTLSIRQMTKFWNYLIQTSGSILVGMGFFSLLEHIFI